MPQHTCGVQRTTLWSWVSPGNPSRIARRVLFSDTGTGQRCVVQASLELVPTSSPPEFASRDHGKVKACGPEAPLKGW